LKKPHKGESIKQLAKLIQSLGYGNGLNKILAKKSSSEKDVLEKKENPKV